MKIFTLQDILQLKHKRISALRWTEYQMKNINFTDPDICDKLILAKIYGLGNIFQSSSSKSFGKKNVVKHL